MVRSGLIVLAGLGALAVALPASAQGTDQGVRCLLASNAFSKLEKDPVKKQVAVATFFFNLGRLDALLSPAQLKAQAIAQSKTLNQQNAGGIMTACAQQVQAKQRALQALSQAARPARPGK